MLPGGRFCAAGHARGKRSGGRARRRSPDFGSASGVVNSLDPNWHRDYSYQYQAGIQQEIARGVTLNLNWYRKSTYQSVFLVNENAVPQSSWSPFTINNPLDGTPITVFNLASSLTALPATNLYQTNAPQSLTRNTYTGYEAQVTARLGKGRFISGGWTMDRQLDRNCAENVTISKSLPDPNTLRYCDTFGDSSLTAFGQNIASLGKVSPPWAHAFTVQGSMPLKWGFVGSISFLSNQYQGGFVGGTGTATLNNGYLARTLSLASATSSVYPANCVGCAPAPSSAALCPAKTVVPYPATIGCAIDPFYNTLQGGETLNLVAPGAVRTDRLNQFDVSFKRTFKIKERYILEPTIQVFNLFNTNAVLTQATTVSPTYSFTTASAGVAQFLDSSKCGGVNAAGSGVCGLGGNASVITNPRLMRLAITFKF